MHYNAAYEMLYLVRDVSYLLFYCVKIKYTVLHSS